MKYLLPDSNCYHHIQLVEICSYTEEAPAVIYSIESRPMTVLSAVSKILKDSIRQIRNVRTDIHARYPVLVGRL